MTSELISSFKFSYEAAEDYSPLVSDDDPKPPKDVTTSLCLKVMDDQSCMRHVWQPQSSKVRVSVEVNELALFGTGKGSIRGPQCAVM